MLSVFERKVGTISILCLQGRIIASDMSNLRNATNDLAGVIAVVLDLKRVTIIDAAGLGLLLELRQKCRANGIEFRLMNLAERINSLLVITRLNTVFEIASPATVLPTSHLKCQGSTRGLASCA